jgi:hypothetical protein
MISIQLAAKIDVFKKNQKDLTQELVAYLQNKNHDLKERFTLWLKAPLSLKKTEFISEEDTPALLLSIVETYGEGLSEYTESDAVELDFVLDELLVNNQWTSEFSYRDETIEFTEKEAEELAEYVVSNNIGTFVNLSMYND